MKNIAAKIDISRINTIGNNNFNNNNSDNTDSWNLLYHDWYYYVSFEIFIEFVINLCYYYYYYDVFTRQLSKLDKIDKLMYILMTHIGSEICQSFIRFSKYYFDKTSILYNKIYKFNINHEWKWLNRLLKLFENNDCQYDEWRIRHSIDMSMKIYSFICIFTILFVEDFITQGKHFLIANKHSYDRGSVHLSITFGIDCIYFLFIFLFNLFVCHYNIWKPILLVNMTDIRVLLFVVSVGFLMWN